MTLKTNWMDVLGYAGLIPFFGFAALTALCGDTDMATTLANYNLLYGLAVVSFLGAVHWGLAIALSGQTTPVYLAGVDQADFEARSFIWGVTPSLLAWLASAFAPTQLALWILTFILLLVWFVDRYFLKPMKVFDHYLKLRTRLTVGAVLGLGLTACFA
ncbi:DUF3429 domain-containing protein [Limnobacter sp.]|uniref:DUF3429 domain-containing protein n=1 Tax=Limnobacter sp. TaxID=2003368 RepID=UPI002732AF4A|nr:DUF3429 domain-containing protein [Limnobacter sp.]MDP3187114.1 DUF3429 domain-containing protein [Limnobacter sp.]